MNRLVKAATSDFISVEAEEHSWGYSASSDFILAKEQLVSMTVLHQFPAWEVIQTETSKSFSMFYYFVCHHQ